MSECKALQTAALTSIQKALVSCNFYLDVLDQDKRNDKYDAYLTYVFGKLTVAAECLRKELLVPDGRILSVLNSLLEYGLLDYETRTQFAEWVPESGKEITRSVVRTLSRVRARVFALLSNQPQPWVCVHRTRFDPQEESTTGASITTEIEEHVICSRCQGEIKLPPSGEEKTVDDTLLKHGYLITQIETSMTRCDTVEEDANEGETTDEVLTARLIRRGELGGRYDASFEHSRMDGASSFLYDHQSQSRREEFFESVAPELRKQLEHRLRTDLAVLRESGEPHADEGVSALSTLLDMCQIDTAASDHGSLQALSYVSD